MRGLTWILALGWASAAAGEEDWKVEVALEAPTGLDCCAIGDVRPDLPGNEIVATAMDGSVYVVWRDGEGWKSERAAKFPGEMIQCAVGDADPAHEGVEIVAVGMVEGREGEGPGAVHLVRRENDAWVAEELFRDTALVHAVCIGDLDPTHDGGEVLVAGFSGRATVLARTAEGWKATGVATLEGNGKSAVFVAGVAAVGTSAGVLLGIERDGEGWKTEVLDRAPAGQSRLGTDGKHILSARDDGVLALILPDGQREIHREDRKLRGAVLADLDPETPGCEAATCGYSGRLTVRRYGKEGQWKEVLHEERSPLHHLAGGELPACGEGVELACASHSGRLIVAWRR